MLPFVVAALVTAQALFAGDSVPLTHTRYAAVHGSPRLVSNGQETLLFWSTHTHVRLTRLDWGSSPPSRVVMERKSGDTFDVVWTGTSFLFVSSHEGGIVGQLIDAGGELAGERFVLAQKGNWPRLAFDGRSVLLIVNNDQSYSDHHDTHFGMLWLQPDGTPVVPQPQARTGHRDGFVHALATNGRSFAAVVGHRFARKLLMLDRDGNVTAQSALPADDLGYADLATDGERYLLADTGGSYVHTRLVQPDGSVGPSLPLDLQRPGDFTTPAALWTGAHWLVAYRAPQDDLSFAIAQVDAGNKSIVRREERGGALPSMAMHAGRVTIAWPLQSSHDVIHVAELPLQGSSGVPVSFSAAEQRLRATASAKQGTLVLWAEEEALHAGLRTRAGGWSERVIWPQQANEAWAATDGEGFAVAFTGPDGQAVVLRLDAEGEPVGEAVRVANFRPVRVLWTGRDYVLSGYHGSQPAAVRLSTAGTLSAPVKVPSPVLASNGNGFYAVWLLDPPFLTPPSPPYGVAGIRLDAELQPLDPSPTTLAPDTYAGYYDRDVAWDGEQYVVLWSSDEGVTAARIPAGGGAPVLQTIDALGTAPARLTRVAGGLAILWATRRSLSSDPSSLQAAMLRPDGTLSSPVTVKPTYEYNDEFSIDIASLPDGDLGVFQTTMRNDAPIEGTIRLTMSVVSAAPLPQRPQALRLTARRHGDHVELRWDSLPQPVTGYRVEYRVDDQPWLEIDQLLPAHRHSVSRPTRGSTIAFRVRAWNDAGLGEYSAVVTPQPARRRRSVAR